MKRLLLAVCALMLCFSMTACGDAIGTNSSGDVGESSEQSNIVFQGSNANATYEGVSSAPGISGCVYLQLQIENIGNTECVYTLADVYVNDSACNTGTGVPVVAAAGKSANGAFIIFTDTPEEDITSIEFKIEIRDNSTFSVLETSQSISVSV